MDEQAFVIMQVGMKDSPERGRADEIYEFVVVPAVTDAGLKPYRADLDLSPGAITQKMLSELLNSRVVIADLTGRNPNVFYELGITHSFVRPLISIADSSGSLPFDAKDERVIELGEYPSSGLGYAQGKIASDSLRESLRIVLADGYIPPSPLRDVAANRSVDQLAPDNPLAAEMAQMRETLESIRKSIIPRSVIPRGIVEEISVLRRVIEDHIRDLDPWDIETLNSTKGTPAYSRWAADLVGKWEDKQQPAERKADKELTGKDLIDRELNTSRFSDEPPF